METYTNAYGDVIPKGWGVSVGNTVKRVPIWKNNRSQSQAHRGYKGWIRVPGTRQPLACGHFHQKSKSARQCAAQQARQMAREIERGSHGDQ